MKRLSEVLRELKAIKDERSRLEKEASDLYKREEKLMEIAEMMMQEEDVESMRITTDGGTSYTAYVYHDQRCRVEDRDAFEAYCDENDVPVEAFMQDSPNKLRSYVKECMENDEPIPPGVSQTFLTSVRFRK